MNEVAEAFWNQDNDFWLVDDPTATTRRDAVQLAFHRQSGLGLCDCPSINLDLNIENCMTVAMTNDDVAEYLTKHAGDGVTLWNLETNQCTIITRKVGE